MNLRERIERLLLHNLMPQYSTYATEQILLAIKEALPEKKKLATSGKSCDETVGFNKAIEEMEKRCE